MDAEPDTEGEESYDQLIAARNRKQKKAGGWQAMGWFSFYRFFPSRWMQNQGMYLSLVWYECFSIQIIQVC